MIVHFVFLKIREDVDADKIEAMYSDVRGLSNLPGVLKIEVGKQEDMYAGYMDRSKGYTHGLVVYLETRDALKNYNDCDRHVEVKDMLGTLIDKSLPDPVMALDWEIDSSL
jgi:hypothetical protein